MFGDAVVARARRAERLRRAELDVDGVGEDVFGDVCVFGGDGGGV
jgi:hypothetical protein